MLTLLCKYLRWLLGGQTGKGKYTLIDLIYLGVSTFYWYWPAVKLLTWRLTQ